MATATARSTAIPVGIIKSFGPYGPEYEVLGPAEPDMGEPQVRIVVVRTGEELQYGLNEMLADPEAV